MQRRRLKGLKIIVPTATNVVFGSAAVLTYTHYIRIAFIRVNILLLHYYIVNYKATLFYNITCHTPRSSPRYLRKNEQNYINPQSSSE